MKTRVTELLGIKYPIVLAGMAFASDAHLTVAVSNAGGLGILGAAMMAPDELRENIRQIRSQTDKPFGVNIMSGVPLMNELGQVIVEEKVPIISFGRGNPDWMIKATKTYGAISMPTVGSLKQALRAEQDGASIIVVQGMEGGGHTGYEGSIVLVPLVASKVKVPVLASGGFCDGGGLVAALAMGAEGIYMGTRFVVTQESAAVAAATEMYLRASEKDTVITPLVTGKRSRGLRNKLGELGERGTYKLSLRQIIRYSLEVSRGFEAPLWKVLLSGLRMRQSAKLSFKEMGYIPAGVSKLKDAMQGDVEWGWFPSGQVCGRIDDIPTCKELIERIVGEAEGILQSLPKRVLED